MMHVLLQFEWPPALSCGQCLRASRRVAMGDPAEVEDDVGLDLTRAAPSGMWDRAINMEYLSHLFKCMDLCVRTEYSRV